MNRLVKFDGKWFCNLKNDCAVSYGTIDLFIGVPLELFLLPKINLFRGVSRGPLQGLNRGGLACACSMWFLGSITSQVLTVNKMFM